MIEILMADDHAIFRSGVRRLLSDEPDMRVVAEAGSGPEAIEYLRHRTFCLVLLDVNMGSRSGIDTLKRIRAEWPLQPVLMLSMYPEEQYVPMALKAGANGYVCKDRDAEDLVVAIRIAARGGYYLSPEQAPGTHTARWSGALSGHTHLTERERQIMQLIVLGVSLTDIGLRLCLSVKTISTYRTRVLTKLGLASNADLVRYSLEHGFDD